MTAEALVCRQFLGMIDRPPALSRSQQLPAARDVPARARTNFYYWYYATLAMYQMQGEGWPKWNEAMQKTLSGRPADDGDAGRQLGSRPGVGWLWRPGLLHRSGYAVPGSLLPLPAAVRRGGQPRAIREVVARLGLASLRPSAGKASRGLTLQLRPVELRLDGRSYVHAAARVRDPPCLPSARKQAAIECSASEPRN